MQILVVFILSTAKFEKQFFFEKLKLFIRSKENKKKIGTTNNEKKKRFGYALL